MANEEWHDPEPTESMEDLVYPDHGTRIEFNIQIGALGIFHTDEWACGSIFYWQFEELYEKMKEFYEKSKRYDDSFKVPPKSD